MPSVSRAMISDTGVIQTMAHCKRWWQLLLGMSAVCGVLWLLTWIAAFEVFLGHWVVAVDLGKTAIGVYTRTFDPDIHARFLSQVVRPDWFTWWPRLIKSQWGTAIFVPLWIPAILFGLPGAYGWLRYRRVHKVGTLCKTCGYDLRGLPHNRCPECGTPFGTDGASNR